MTFFVPAAQVCVACAQDAALARGRTCQLVGCGCRGACGARGLASVVKDATWYSTLFGMLAGVSAYACPLPHLYSLYLPFSSHRFPFSQGRGSRRDGQSEEGRLGGRDGGRHSVNSSARDDYGERTLLARAYFCPSASGTDA